jgi:hypothetical protein
LVDSTSDQELEEINKQWKLYTAHAEDSLQQYEFLTNDIYAVISDWFKTDDTKRVVVPPHNITLASWTHFLLSMTMCVASYYEGHKLVTAFIENSIVVSFTTRSRYPSKVTFVGGETYFMNTQARGGNLHGHFAMKASEFFGLTGPNSSYGTMPIRLHSFKNIHIHKNFLVETRDFQEILDDIKMREKVSCV